MASNSNSRSARQRVEPAPANSPTLQILNQKKNANALFGGRLGKDIDLHIVSYLHLFDLESFCSTSTHGLDSVVEFLKALKQLSLRMAMPEPLRAGADAVCQTVTERLEKGTLTQDIFKALAESHGQASREVVEKPLSQAQRLARVHSLIQKFCFKLQRIDLLSYDFGEFPQGVTITGKAGPEFVVRLIKQNAATLTDLATSHTNQFSYGYLFALAMCPQLRALRLRDVPAPSDYNPATFSAVVLDTVNRCRELDTIEISNDDDDDDDSNAKCLVLDETASAIVQKGLPLRTLHVGVLELSALRALLLPAYSGLTSLRFDYREQNTKLLAQALQALHGLTSLTISGAAFAAVPAELLKLPALTFLEVSIDRFFRVQTPKLETLHCSGDSAGTLLSVLQSAPMLQMLTESASNDKKDEDAPLRVWTNAQLRTLNGLLNSRRWNALTYLSLERSLPLPTFALIATACPALVTVFVQIRHDPTFLPVVARVLRSLPALASLIFVGGNPDAEINLTVTEHPSPEPFVIASLQNMLLDVCSDQWLRGFSFPKLGWLSCGGHAFRPSAAELFRAAPNLEELHLNSQLVIPADGNIGVVAAALKKLVISNQLVEWSDADIIAVLRACPAVTHLTVDGVSATFLHALVMVSLPKLRILIIKDQTARFSVASVAACINAFPRLGHFDLTGLINDDEKTRAELVQTYCAIQKVWKRHSEKHDFVTKMRRLPWPGKQYLKPIEDALRGPDTDTKA